MKRIALLSVAAALVPLAARAGDPPLLPPATARALAAELSGASARGSVDALARHHRMRGSRGFHAAAEYVRAQLKASGLDDAHIETLPRRRAHVLRHAEEPAAVGRRLRRAVGAATEPARGSRASSTGEHPAGPGPGQRRAARPTADLVDVGTGTAEADYAGKDVKGKLVLAAAQPGPVARLAVAAARRRRHRQLRAEPAHGLVGRRRGPAALGPPRHASPPTRRSRSWCRPRRPGPEGAAGRRARRCACRPRGGRPARRRLRGRDRHHARRRSRAARRGDRLQLPPRPPAARAPTTTPAAAPPSWRSRARWPAWCRTAGSRRRARTLRFIWPPEVEGTVALLNARARAGRAHQGRHPHGHGRRRPATTKAVFHVTRGPASLPSFVNDVAEAFGEFVNARDLRACRRAAPRLPARRRRRRQGARCRRRWRSSRWAATTRSTPTRSFGIPADLPERLARPLHPHQARPAGEHRRHQAASAPASSAPPPRSRWPTSPRTTARRSGACAGPRACAAWRACWAGARAWPPTKRPAHPLPASTTSARLADSLDRFFTLAGRSAVVDRGAPRHTGTGRGRAARTARRRRRGLPAQPGAQGPADRVRLRLLQRQVRRGEGRARLRC